MPTIELTTAEVNHLRRLLGWVSCEVGQAPDELVATVRELMPTLGPVSDEAKARLVQSHQKANNVPQYVHAAVKSLTKAILPADAAADDVHHVDGEYRIEGAPMLLSEVPTMIAKLHGPASA